MIRRGTIGTHRYYCISFRRHNPEEMLMVADRQGRILHVSSSLAKLLDTTVEHLQADNSPGALDAIMPEPFLQLHRSHLQTSMPLPDHLTSPTVSCFTGVTVCLSSISASPIR